MAAPQSPELPDDLTAVSLEDLTRIRVTSVAKKQQPLARAAAAIFVVTADDIRRMGATSIPEALRFVPGVHVARIDGNKWAVSARGFGGRFSNKLVVLIDGRTIYSPLFSGVFWEMYDIPMETIERIEVIRGPGATMWGANAVNGVINVITKSPSEAVGGTAAMQAGSVDGPISSVRFGGAGAGGAYSVFAKTQARFSSPDDDLEVPVNDGWRSLQTGFRYSADLSDRDELEVLGGASRMTGHQRSFGPILDRPFHKIAVTEQGSSNGHLLGRWRRTFSERSDLSLQAYYDHVIKLEADIYRASTRAADIELQHRFRPGKRHELTWGAGYRSVFDHLQGSQVLVIDKPRRNFQYANAFVQEELQLIPESLWVTAGTKVEQNTFGGFALEPSLRALWTPTRRTSIWGAISRAARAPSRGERDVQFDLAALRLSPSTAALVSLIPNPELDYENMTAYEIGFRASGHEKWSLDVAAFENHYRDVAGIALLQPRLASTPQPHVVVPMQLQNKERYKSRGAELALKLRPVERWDLQAAGTLLDFERRSTESPFSTEGAPNPVSQYSVRSSWQFRRDFEWNVSWAYTGSIAAAGLLKRGNRLPGHVRVDTRLEWRRHSGMRISVGAQDVLDSRHFEFDPESLTVASPVGRNIYGRISWGF